MHSVYSKGGELTPEQLAAAAREAGLDFIATTVVEWRTSAEESAFVRVEVRDHGGNMAALTNPIILN